MLVRERRQDGRRRWTLKEMLGLLSKQSGEIAFISGERVRRDWSGDEGLVFNIHV